MTKAEKIKLVLVIMIVNLLMMIGVVYAEGKINSNEIYYDNTLSKRESSEVQGALDELFDEANDYVGLMNTVIDKVYPIGSIYISENKTNPGDLFGGTWIEYGKGKTLVGVEDNGTSGQTGGTTTATLKVENLPSHTHTTPSTSLSNGKTGLGIVNNGGFLYTPGNNLLGGTHDIVSYGSGTYSSTYSNGVSNVPGMGLNHYHNVTGTIPAMTTSSVGDGASFSVQNPYITVYMWKRIS